jgi:hypothetical protein
MKDVLMYCLYYWPFIILTIGFIVLKVLGFLNPSEPIPNYRIKRINYKSGRSLYIVQRYNHHYNAERYEDKGKFSTLTEAQDNILEMIGNEVKSTDVIYNEVS